MKALKAGVATRGRAGTGGSKLKKGKRRKGEGDAEGEAAVEKPKEASPSKEPASWGMLEPLHGILGPFVDPITSLIGSNTIIAFLIFLLLVNWLRAPKAGYAGDQIDYARMPSPQRMAAYEEIWRTEESELWKWLEERMEMQDANYPASNSKRHEQPSRHLRNQEAQAKMARKEMDEREVNHAIKVTEEKLEVLKASIQSKKRPEKEGVSEQAQASSQRKDPAYENSAGDSNS